jgi:hypothetical protein
MNRVFFAATALGLAFGGSAFAQSTTTSQTDSGVSDLWASMPCSEFVQASDDDQSEIVASLQGNRLGMDDGTRSDATGSAAEAESNMAINSGADVSAGTRGVDQSGTAALTGEGATEGDPAGTTHNSVSVEEVVEACESSPSSRVSEVVDEQMTQ